MAASKVKQDNEVAKNEDVNDPTALHDGIQVELNEADKEIVEAGNLAELIANEEGVKVKVAETSRPERREISPSELIKRAQRQREAGNKMLSRKRSGLASVTKDVEINNYLISSLFSRFFPVIDQCIYSLQTQGEYRLGEAPANKIMEQILARIDEIFATCVSDVNATDELINEIMTRDNPTLPTYPQPAYKDIVQIRTPEGLRLLNAFMLMDKIVLNLATLYWNGDRLHTDMQDAVQAQKKAIVPLFTLCSRTLIQMRNRLNQNQQKK